MAAKHEHLQAAVPPQLWVQLPVASQPAEPCPMGVPPQN